jgi:hypothetical protein
MRRVYTIVLILMCSNVTLAKDPGNGAQEFSQYAFCLSEVMLHDVVNPPAASRFYAYAMLGAYEAMYAGDKDQPDLTRAFVHDPRFKLPPVPARWSKSFCAIYTMLDVGRQIMPSGYRLEERQKDLVELYRKRYKLSVADIDVNKTFAVQIASQVMSYAKTDGYSKLSTLTRYTPNTRQEGYWYPTPPEYMGAVEPHWRTIRPFFLDSASQFKPAPPVAFNQEQGKPFYDLMKEVYETTQRLSTEQKAIAAFWDCNPFAVQYSGHMAIGIKKISPGGHWIGITGIACRQSGASIEKTITVHTLVALTLCDAFISCWDEKYRSDRIRPEAAINKYLDPSWRPLLQTPPFPEYSSGHSVISTASAAVLTFIFGESFRFADTSEEYFGLPARTFPSFREAANEAAVSRLYGGIHFRDAIEQGQGQGQAIAGFIIQKISNIKPLEQ